MGTGWPVDDVSAWLTGSWTVDRVMTDRGAGATGRFVGRLDVVPGPDGWDLGEDGEVRWGTHRGPATRHLRARDRGDGTVDVTFTDGRHFYLLDLRRGATTVTHPCAEDRYDGRLTVDGPDRWRSVWEVTGPAKDLCLETVHTRRSPPAG